MVHLGVEGLECLFQGLGKHVWILSYQAKASGLIFLHAKKTSASQHLNLDGLHTARSTLNPLAVPFENSERPFNSNPQSPDSRPSGDVGTFLAIRGVRLIRLGGRAPYVEFGVRCLGDVNPKPDSCDPPPSTGTIQGLKTRITCSIHTRYDSRIV